jgi:type IV secretion system T-DNA border endonuclease VirD1
MTLMLGRIASAMNEMSRVAKQNQSVDAAAFLQERKNLGTEFARLETQLQYLLNVSKRRQDGNKRLQEANEDWQKNSKNELGRVLFTNRSFKSNG